MDFVFDRGDKQRPKGHALLYFRSSSAPDEVWVTYIVILPVSIDVSKYVPPFLMNQMGELGPKDLSAFAFPPAPERLGDYAALEAMAEMRDDDVLSGGAINPDDVASSLMSVGEVVQRYAETYAQIVADAAPTGGDGEGALPGLAVNDVLYGLMSDGDKLSELTKLVGRLRFALDGSERNLIQESEEEIDLLARHFPENHSIPQLVEAVKSSDSRGAKLADLYLQRCFHLVHEDYAKVAKTEEEIRSLERELAADQG